MSSLAVPVTVARGKYRQPTTQATGGKDFCYECHHEARRHLRCVHCQRKYHARCVKSLLSAGSDSFTCTFCNANLKEKSMTPRISRQRLSKAFEFALNVITDDIDKKEFSALFDPIPATGDPFDINYEDIRKAIKSSNYDSINDFLDDFQYIYHVCYIVHKSRSSLTKCARKVYKRAEIQCAKMFDCIQCFENELTEERFWFSEICNPPHVIAWAKVMGHSYWPCKVLKVFDSCLNVSFFGTHQRARVATSACRLYSKECPSGSGMKATSQMTYAMAEVQTCIMKLKRQYGTFNHAPAKSVFDPSKEEAYRALMLSKLADNVGPWKDLHLPMVPNLSSSPISAESSNPNQPMEIDEPDVRLSQKPVVVLKRLNPDIVKKYMN